MVYTYSKVYTTQLGLIVNGYFFSEVWKQIFGQICLLYLRQIRSPDFLFYFVGDLCGIGFHEQ